jgi:hypothetical protein
MLSACRVIRNIFIIEFSGGFLSHHLFHYLSLHLGLSVCFLLSFLSCLFFLTVGSVYQDAIQSLHFSFIYIKNTKKIHFAFWNLLFWVFSIDLDT